MKRRAAMMLGLTGGALVLTGCVERRLSITSEPPGARVWVNDTPVGLTPVETAFVYHGVYDVRVEADGYEPLLTSAEAVAPWYEYPLVDLVAEAMPFVIENRQKWHFRLSPELEAIQERADFEGRLLDRAAQLRDLSSAGGLRLN